MKIRNTAVRLTGAAVLSTLGLAALGVAAAGPAAAVVTTTTTVPVNYNCNFPLIGSTAVTISVVTTVPSMAGVGQTTSASATASLMLPFLPVATANLLGVSDVNTTGVTAVVTGTDVTPASATASLSAPVDTKTASLGSPIKVTLNPVSFTPLATGTATFKPGNLTLSLTINPSSVWFIGGPQTVACTVSGTAPTLASVTVVPNVVAPIGVVGIVGLALFSSASFIVVQRRHTRRHTRRAVQA